MRNVFLFAFMGILLNFSLARSAVAVLGEQAEASVGTTASGLHGTRVPPVNSGSYIVYEIDRPGLSVREFADALSGRVFAVAWKGEVLPDLGVLTGGYFQEIQEASQANPRDSKKRMSSRSIQGDHVVLETSGHMRALRGKAYIPDLIPEGVRLDAIQ